MAHDCYSTVGDNVRHCSHKSNIASKKWIEPFTGLLPNCLFDHMHSRELDLHVMLRVSSLQ